MGIAGSRYPSQAALSIAAATSSDHGSWTVPPAHVLLQLGVISADLDSATGDRLARDRAQERESAQWSADEPLALYCLQLRLANGAAAAAALRRVNICPRSEMSESSNPTQSVGDDKPGLSLGSADRFGYQWSHYSELRAEYEEQFRRWTVHLSGEDWRGKSFLDVGCGTGRNSYWPMMYGAAGGKAIDVDRRSLAVARRNLARFPSVSVEEKSAYEIGETNSYDIVFSIGVIHHLEFPERAIGEMVRAAKRGGLLLIWVYGYENNEWIVRVFDPLRKALFSRLPIGLVHHLSLYPTMALWVTLRMGIGRIRYFDLLRGVAFKHLRCIVFDQMLPKISHYWPRSKVEAMLRESGLADVRVAWVNEMSWSAIGTKPATPDGSEFGLARSQESIKERRR
jgi:SAM-dependent methyltransferase